MATDLTNLQAINRRIAGRALRIANLQRQIDAAQAKQQVDQAALADCIAELDAASVDELDTELQAAGG